VNVARPTSQLPQRGGGRAQQLSEHVALNGNWQEEATKSAAKQVTFTSRPFPSLPTIVFLLMGFKDKFFNL